MKRGLGDVPTNSEYVESEIRLHPPIYQSYLYVRHGFCGGAIEEAGG